MIGYYFAFSSTYDSSWYQHLVPSDIFVHSSRCVVESVWFYFAFLWYLMMLNTFCLLTGHLYIFFGKLAVQLCCMFFNWSVRLFIIGYRSNIHSGYNLFLDLYVANIFPQPIICFYFEEQNVLILMYPILSIFFFFISYFKVLSRKIYFYASSFSLVLYIIKESF